MKTCPPGRGKLLTSSQ